MFSSSTDANKTHPSATSGSTFPASEDPLARSTNTGAPLGATTGDQTYNHGHSGASLDHDHAGTPATIGTAHSTKDQLDPTTGRGTHLGGPEHGDHVKHDGHSHQTVSGTGAHGTGVPSTADKLNPTTGRGTHTGQAEVGDQVHTKHDTHPHSATGSAVPGAAQSTQAELDPTTGRGTHTGGAEAADHSHKKHDTHDHAHKNVPGSASLGEHAHPSAQHKPTMAEKAKGAVETLVGKVTHNPAKVEQGTELKTGHAQPKPSTYDA